MNRSLWLHLVSRHADGLAVIRTEADNVLAHEREHAGPGTIRNHPVGDLSYNLYRAQVVLAELLEQP
jgi:hypothetical protein